MEANVLEKKESKSQWYYRRGKRESDSDSSSSSSFRDRRPLFSPPIKMATPRFISPPPLTVNAPSFARPLMSCEPSTSQQLNKGEAAQESQQSVQIPIQSEDDSVEQGSREQTPLSDEGKQPF